MKFGVHSTIPFKDPVSLGYQLVVGDCLYDTIQEVRTQRLIGRIAAFKIDAYGREYPYGVLPFDSGDFAGTHFLLCESKQGELIPVIGFKCITLEQCKKFRISFPPYHYVEGFGLEQQREAVHSIVSSAEQERKKIGYIGSWTMHPDRRTDRNFIRIGYDFLATHIARWAVEYKIDIGLTFAATRFKVDRFHRFMGMDELALRGKVLPGFTLESYYDEPISGSVLWGNRLNQDMQLLMAAYQNLWEQRLVIRGSRRTEEEKKAA